jgi:hypothetical protein
VLEEEFAKMAIKKPFVGGVAEGTDLQVGSGFEEKY